MAARKSKKSASSKKRRRPRKKKSSPVSASLLKTFFAIIILIGLAMGMAFVAGTFIDVPEPNDEKTASPGESLPAASVPPKPAGPKPPASHKALPDQAKPRFEIYPHEPGSEGVKEPTPPRETEKPPMVALIIDDLGYDRKMADGFLSIDAAMTVAILPGSPLQQVIVEKAHARGFEIMLHQPMEPNEYPAVDPGPEALLSNMGADELIRQFENNIAAMPHLKGVNNHMGSRLTSESDRMNQVFGVLKQNGLFFIDSRTTTETTARSSARLFQVPFGERDVFLDHKQDAAFIKNQFKRLVQIAHKNGSAVGIAHPHPLTLKILQETLPELLKQVKLVPASRIVHMESHTG